MPLSSTQKKHLKGLCHHLQPVVTVAAKGLTDNVMAEIAQALEHHELIKIKLRQERELRKSSIEAIADGLGAETVMTIGQVACFYKANPKKEPGKRLTIPKA